MTKIHKLIVILVLNIWLVIKLYQGDYGLFSSLIWITSIFFLYKIVSPPDSIKKDFRLPISLILLLLFVFFIKAIFISLYPSSISFHGDEAINSRNAQINFQTGINSGVWNLLSSGQGTLNKMPALWYFLQGGLIWVLGPSLLSVKIFTLISDLILCCFIYLIIKKLFNKSLALFATALYISLPIAIHFSMTGYQNLQSTVMLFVSIYFLCLITNTSKKQELNYYCLTSGIICGVSLYFYLSSVINPIICILIIFSIFIFEDKNKIYNKAKYFFNSLVYFVTGFIIPAIPFIYYSVYKYDFANGRSNEYMFSQLKSDFAGTLIIQTKNFLKGFLPSGEFNGFGQHYIKASILPGTVIFILFIIGLLICLKKINQRIYFVSLIIFIVTSVTGGLLTKDPPTSQRLIHLFPLIIFFVIFAINLIKIRWIQSIFVIYLIIINIKFYLSTNIPSYQKKLDKDVCEISKIITQKDQKIFFYAPIHKKDQIYYYSRGRIKLVPISQNFFANIDSGYYFVDYKNLGLFKDRFSEVRVIKDWTNIYDHTVLLKIN